MINNKSIHHSEIKPYHLSSEIDLSEFDCGNPDLNDFLISDALPYQDQKIAQTTCIFYEKVLIGYYTLTCDALSLERRIRKKLFQYKKRIHNYPAVKIARMAFQKEYQHRKLGTTIIEVIVGLVWNLNNRGIASRFVTVDAYPNAVEFYKKCGFEYNLKEQEPLTVEELINQKRTVSMRLDILKYTGKL